MIADAARQHPPPTCWRGAQQITKPQRCKTQFYFPCVSVSTATPPAKHCFIFPCVSVSTATPPGGPRNGQGGAAGLPWAWGAVAANP